MTSQVDSVDCGPACLATVLAHWGRHESLHYLRDLAGTTRTGTTLLGLYRAAQALGLKVKALEVDLERLHGLTLPVILHWEDSHYVVLAKLCRRKALIYDPATGKRWVSLQELTQHWVGKLLWLEPAEGFESNAAQRARGLRGLLSRLALFKGSVWVLAQLAFGTVVLASLNLAAPVLSQILFDDVLAKHNSALMPYLLMGIFFLLATQTSFGAVQGFLAGRLLLRLDAHLQRFYLNHLLRLPQRIHETRLVGDLLSRFGDLSQVQGVLASFLLSVPAALLTLLLSLGLIASYNLSLAVVALVNLPLQIVYLLWLSPRLKRINRKQLEKSGEVQSFLIGSLDGLSTLKTRRAENWALSRGTDKIAELVEANRQGLTLSTWGGIVFGLLSHVGTLITLWYGAAQVLHATLTVGQLVAAYGLVQSAVQALSQVTSNLEQIQEGVVASDRLSEVLELPTEQDSGKIDSLLPLRELAVEGVTFAYTPGKYVLKDATFSLTKGSYTALVGTNGAGKSTLSSLLAKMLEPDAGQISWDGVPFSQIKTDEVRRHVVYSRQEVSLFYATLLENLTLGLDVDEAKLWALLEALDMEGVVQRLPKGLETVVGGDSIYKLSSGERQLLGLARALLSSAEVIVLDEPTATLDVAREERVVRLLEQLKGERTLLVITHRPALLAPAGQILELRAGSLTLKQEPLAVAAAPLSLL